jgi:hypothetical protein
VNVVTGEGQSEALAGADCFVDAATWPSSEQEAATEFFTAAARYLHEVGERAGVQRIAGPREESLVDVARLLAARWGDSLRIESVSDPDDPEQALYASGALLPGPDAVLAGPTFEQWLDSTT